MKRLKLMMLSLGLIAIVGGALAFKAKVIKAKICYTTTNLNTTCGLAWLEGNFTNQGTRFTYYTTEPKDLNGQKVCYDWDQENPDITTPLPCTTQIMLTTAEF